MTKYICEISASSWFHYKEIHWVVYEIHIEGKLL